MLVLQRKIDEGFWLDGNTFVKVISIGKRRVTLGIDAPVGVTVTRDELRTSGDGDAEAQLQQILPGRRRQQ